MGCISPLPSPPHPAIIGVRPAINKPHPRLTSLRGEPSRPLSVAPSSGGHRVLIGATPPHTHPTTTCHVQCKLIFCVCDERRGHAGQRNKRTAQRDGNGSRRLAQTRDSAHDQSLHPTKRLSSQPPATTAVSGIVVLRAVEGGGRQSLTLSHSAGGQQ